MTKRLSIRLLGVAALVATLAACTLERGENRVWRPGDPDPERTTFFGPWNYSDAAGGDYVPGRPSPPPPDVSNPNIR